MRLGLLADLHWSVAPAMRRRGWHAPYDFDGLAARCAATVDALAARGCELLVVAGDLTHDGDAASCEAALDCILRRLADPGAVVEGNHDVRLDRDARPGAAPHVRDGVAARRRRVADEQLVALRAVGVGRDGRCGARPRRRPLPAHGLATVVVSHFPLVRTPSGSPPPALPCPRRARGARRCCSSSCAARPSRPSCSAATCTCATRSPRQRAADVRRLARRTAVRGGRSSTSTRSRRSCAARASAATAPRRPPAAPSRGCSPSRRALDVRGRVPGAAARSAPPAATSSRRRCDERHAAGSTAACARRARAATAAR